MRSILLNNGQSIPNLAFGAGTTWSKRDGGALDQKLVEALKSALSVGFKHIDLAEMYGNNAEVAMALADFPREGVFVTHKLLKSLSSTSNVKDTAQQLISELNVDYLDLLLLHAPFLPPNCQPLEMIWRQLEDLVESKLVKSIGVSNFRIEDLQQLLKTARIKPAVNQIEFHPYLQQHDLLEFCSANDIVIAGYSVLLSLSRKTGGPVDAVVRHFAESKGVSEDEVLISWALQKGIVVVTTTSQPQRLQKYADLAEGNASWLTPEELYAIDTAGLRLSHRQFWQKEFGFIN